jgi:hypothetical protein
MLSGLKTLFGLVGLLTSLYNTFQRWRMKREVTQEVVTEIQKKEDDFAKRATEVVAADRPDTDAADKLRKGVF